MEQNDYYVIVYKVLSYLYEELKASNKTDLTQLRKNLNIEIGDLYWCFILNSLYDKEFIKCYTGVKIDIMITINGVEYLLNDSNMEKVEKHLWKI